MRFRPIINRVLCAMLLLIFVNFWTAWRSRDSSDVAWPPSSISVLLSNGVFKIAPQPIIREMYSTDCRPKRDLFAGTSEATCITFSDLGKIRRNNLWHRVNYPAIWYAYPQDVDLVDVVAKTLRGETIHVVRWFHVLFKK